MELTLRFYNAFPVYRYSGEDAIIDMLNGNVYSMVEYAKIDLISLLSNVFQSAPQKLYLELRVTHDFINLTISVNNFEYRAHTRVIINNNKKTYKIIKEGQWGRKIGNTDKRYMKTREVVFTDWPSMAKCLQRRIKFDCKKHGTSND